MHVVIVGSSAAGVSAAETIRRLRGTEYKITMVSEESEDVYSRCLLPDLLAGRKTEEGIRFRPKDFFQKAGVDFLNGISAVELHPREKRLVLKNGHILSYDRLLLATGSSAALPDVPGADASGIFTLRTMADVRLMRKVMPGAAHVAVLGGGLIGLKAAYAFKMAGIKKVTVVVASDHLLSRQLDEEAAFLVEKELKNAGIEFLYNEDVQSFLPGAGGKLAGVLLKSGRELSVEVTLAAKGVRPNSALVEKAGGLVGRGIKVDNLLRTSLKDVYAAGDCIEVTDRLTGERVSSALWTLAAEQGRYAAANILNFNRPYPLPLTRLNSARFGRVDFISAGRLTGPEVQKHHDRINNTYRRLVFDGDRLVGFILAGKVDGAGVYTVLARSGRPLGTLKSSLLHGNAGETVLAQVMKRASTI